MLRIFPAVFESVWKRKETKIYLSFAFISLGIYFLSTFVPNTKFLQFQIAGGLKPHFLFAYAALSQVNDIFQSLALIYLTYSVFRHEVDNHVFFLYKDIDRRQIIFAKLLSLVAVVGIFFLLSFLATLAVYYGRLVPAGIADTTFIRPKEFLSDLYQIFSFQATSIIYVFATAFFSMRMRVAGVMVASLVFNLSMQLFSAIGSPLAKLVPLGFGELSWESKTAPIAFVAGIGLTIFYVLVFGQLTARKFQSLEF